MYDPNIWLVYSRMLETTLRACCQNMTLMHSYGVDSLLTVIFGPCKGTGISQISSKEERESDQGDSPSVKEEELDEQEEKPAVCIPAVFRRPFEHVSSCRVSESYLTATLSVSPDGKLSLVSHCLLT